MLDSQTKDTTKNCRLSVCLFFDALSLPRSLQVARLLARLLACWDGETFLFFVFWQRIKIIAEAWPKDAQIRQKIIPN